MDNCLMLGTYSRARTETTRTTRTARVTFQPPGGDEVARIIRAMLVAIAARAICLSKQIEADQEKMRDALRRNGGWASNTSEQQVSSQ